jgi:hypothetical protein
MSEEVTQTKSLLQQLCDGSARVRIEFPNDSYGGAISALSGKSPFNNVSGVGISVSSGESAVNVCRVGVSHTRETNDLPVQIWEWVVVLSQFANCGWSGTSGL